LPRWALPARGVTPRQRLGLGGAAARAELDGVGSWEDGVTEGEALAVSSAVGDGEGVADGLDVADGLGVAVGLGVADGLGLAGAAAGCSQLKVPGSGWCGMPIAVIESRMPTPARPVAMCLRRMRGSSLALLAHIRYRACYA
jgi:hypothetical protein